MSHEKPIGLRIDEAHERGRQKGYEAGCIATYKEAYNDGFKAAVEQRGLKAEHDRLYTVAEREPPMDTELLVCHIPLNSTKGYWLIAECFFLSKGARWWKDRDDFHFAYSPDQVWRYLPPEPK